MAMFIKLLGILGNVAFGWACLPTAYQTWKKKASIGTPISLAWNIFTACVLFYTYTFLTYMKDPIVWICGLVEILCYLIVLYYHYFPRRVI